MATEIIASDYNLICDKCKNKLLLIKSINARIIVTFTDKGKCDLCRKKATTKELLTIMEQTTW